MNCEFTSPMLEAVLWGVGWAVVTYVVLTVLEEWRKVG